MGRWFEAGAMRGGTWVRSPVVLGPSVSSSCKWAWEPSECCVDLERLPVGNAQRVLGACGWL